MNSNLNINITYRLIPASFPPERPQEPRAFSVNHNWDFFVSMRSFCVELEISFPDDAYKLNIPILQNLPKSTYIPRTLSFFLQFSIQRPFYYDLPWSPGLSLACLDRICHHLQNRKRFERSNLKYLIYFKHQHVVNNFWGLFSNCWLFD